MPLTREECEENGLFLLRDFHVSKVFIRNLEKK